MTRARNPGPPSRSFAPASRSAHPGFAAPASRGSRLGRTGSPGARTVVSGPPEPGVRDFVPGTPIPTSGIPGPKSWDSGPLSRDSGPTKSKVRKPETRTPASLGPGCRRFRLGGAACAKPGESPSPLPRRRSARRTGRSSRLAPGQGQEAVGAAQAAAIEDERGRSRRARLQAALRKPLQPRPCHRATEPPLCAPQDQFHAEAAGKRLGQGPLNPTRVFAFLKEPGQFFEEDEWTNPDSSMTCAAACPSLVGPRTPGREWSPRTVARSALLRRSKARLSKNFAWAVDAKGRQAPVTAHLPAYRLAFDLAATDACVW